MTPREALIRLEMSAVHSVSTVPEATSRRFAEYAADAELAALSAAGFEIVPTALVDAVLEQAEGLCTVPTAEAIATLRDYRRAPVLLGQTEE